MKRNLTKEDRAIVWLVLSLVLIWLSFLPIYFSAPAAPLTKKEATKKEPSPTDYFSGLKLEAKSFIVYEADSNQVIYERNGRTPRPLASITKVMTALTADDIARLKNMIVTIDGRALTEEGDSGLLSGERWSLKALSNLTLVSSSNDGARAIAETAGNLAGVNFISEMNRKAKDLGMASTTFYNPTGLDLNAGQAGAYGSALDVAKLFSYIIKEKPDLLTATQKASIQVSSLSSKPHQVFNTDDIVGEIPGLLASKTGFTTIAGGNLAIAANMGLSRPVVFVVLGSSESGRFTDMKELIKATQSYYADKEGH